MEASTLAVLRIHNINHRLSRPLRAPRASTHARLQPLVRVLRCELRCVSLGTTPREKHAGWHRGDQRNGHAAVVVRRRPCLVRIAWSRWCWGCLWRCPPNRSVSGAARRPSPEVPVTDRASIGAGTGTSSARSLGSVPRGMLRRSGWSGWAVGWKRCGGGDGGTSLGARVGGVGVGALCAARLCSTRWTSS